MELFQVTVSFVATAGWTIGHVLIQLGMRWISQTKILDFDRRGSLVIGLPSIGESVLLERGENHGTVRLSILGKRRVSHSLLIRRLFKFLGTYSQLDRSVSQRTIVVYPRRLRTESVSLLSRHRIGLALHDRVREANTPNLGRRVHDVLACHS